MYGYTSAQSDLFSVVVNNDIIMRVNNDIIMRICVSMSRVPQSPNILRWLLLCCSKHACRCNMDVCLWQVVLVLSDLHSLPGLARAVNKNRKFSVCGCLLLSPACWLVLLILELFI